MREMAEKYSTIGKTLKANVLIIVSNAASGTILSFIERRNLQGGSGHGGTEQAVARRHAHTARAPGQPAPGE